MSTLSVYGVFNILPPQGCKLMMFIEIYDAIVRDGVDPMAMHEAMLAVDEYRALIAKDMLNLKRRSECEE